MIAPKRRRLDPLDYVFLLWNGFMQYSIEFERTADVRPAIEEILRCVNAFRTRAGWVYLSEAKQETPVHAIPPNLETLHDVNDWMFRAHTPRLSRCLGAIAADRNRVVVNASHICGDGKFIARLIEHLSDPSGYGTLAAATVPMSSHYYFLKDIMQRKKKGLPIVCGYDPYISRITPGRVPDRKHAEYRIQYVREPISALRCYNRSTDACEKLTESLWLAVGLTNSAFIEKLQPFGVSTVFDLRRVLPKSELANAAIQNYIASIAVKGSPSPDTTVAALARQMRDDFQQKVARGDHFGHMKAVHNVIYKPWTNRNTAGLGLEVSSIGPIKIGGAVKDCHITLSAPGSEDLHSISFMCYTLEHRERKTKQFIGQFQYTSKELHDLDAFVLTESVGYALRNLDPSATVGRAVSELRQFQRLIS
jgi:hypothetical protein